MYRKYYLVEVVLLLLLSHGGWNGPSVTLLSCTSESSKLVRDVVQKRFLSVVERYRVPLPLECPLHPKRDMFWWLQTELEATKREGEEGWHCPVCGRKFGCENTFVTHWDASHSRTLLGMAGETVCLDDYCDVFRCDVLRRRMLRVRMEEEDELRKHSTAGSQGIAIFQHMDTEYEDEVMKEKKKNCDSKAMSQVHHKCRSLIRQCTLGMVANLSSKDFQDIEEDLDQSICSFLTCDRYWDDFEPHIHRVPVLVFAIFGLLVVSLFCFCYYGMWLLLEKSTMNSSQVCCSCQKASSIDGYYRQKRLKQRKKHNSPELINKPNSLEYITSENFPDHATRQKSPEYTTKKYSPEIMNETNRVRSNKKSLEYNSREDSLEYDSRENSPEYNSRKNSPEYDSRRNSPEYDSRQNSTEYNSRQNSPYYDSRQNSPEYNTRQKSPENHSRQNSPEYSSRKHFPEYVSRENSPDYNSRQNSPEYFSKRIYSECRTRESSPEYSSRQQSSEYKMRQNSPRYKTKLNFPEYNSQSNSPEYNSKKQSSEYITKQNSPRFNTKSNSPEYNSQSNSPEYNSQSNSPEYDYRLNSSEFKSKQNSSTDHCHQNPSEYKHKSLDIHQRKKTGIAYSQSSNALQLPQRNSSRMN